jgi:nucleoside-diphosphate-sugar epimerase
MAKLLVIGGTGFFGKSILDGFQRGLLRPWGIRSVIAMSRTADRLRAEVPSALLRNVELLALDLARVSRLPEADYVIHAAASASASQYLTNALEERANIVAGADNFARLGREFSSGSKIVYVSSGAVYGTQPGNLPTIPEDYLPASLDDMPPEKADYARGKQEAEAIIRRLGSERQANVSIARCFAFVGPWLPRDRHFAVGNFLRDGLEGRAVHVKARQQVWRSYMYSDDLVEWLMTIADHAHAYCPTYNVGSYHAISVQELAARIAAEFGVPVEASPVTDDRPDRYVPDVGKAMKDLGVKIKYDLPDAISATIRSIRAC